VWAEREATMKNAAQWIRDVESFLSPSSPMNRTQGVRLARRFKRLLLDRGYPVRRVVLYGSVAKGTATAKSDIDIAVVTDGFRESRIREGGDILLASKDIDLRIETVTLHPEDFDRPFFTLAREIERTGVEV
jgi:predicted nucleotidyltransferase